MPTTKELFQTLTKPVQKWEPYFDVYDRYFAKYVGKSPKVLEIGVKEGGSLELWQRYFGPGAEIIGIDIDPATTQLQFDGNVKVVLGDQADPYFWDNFLAANTDFDVVLDDGGHGMDQQIITLIKVFPHIKSDGVYICEDSCTSYWLQFDGGIERWNTFIEFSKKAVDVLNFEHFDPSERGRPIVDAKYVNEMQANLYSVAYYNSMVVLEKRPREPFKNWSRP